MQVNICENLFDFTVKNSFNKLNIIKSIHAFADKYLVTMATL